jgi:hypothetical protein
MKRGGLQPNAAYACLLTPQGGTRRGVTIIVAGRSLKWNPNGLVSNVPIPTGLARLPNNQTPNQTCLGMEDRPIVFEWM